MEDARDSRGSAVLRFALGVVLFAAGCASSRPALRWSQLPPVPDREGFAGHFAGVSGGELVVAGGSNFPDQRPWDGGKKVWYDQVFALPSPNACWTEVGRLPRPNAYGVSVSTADGILCVGGGDASEHFRDVFLVGLERFSSARSDIRSSREDGRHSRPYDESRRLGRVKTALSSGGLTITPLRPLPMPCAFMAGALVGQTVYIVGGIDTPAATRGLRTFWSLDLNRADAGWRSLPPCPGPGRILAVAGSAGGSFYLFGGASLSAGTDGKPVREYLRDAWRYTPGSGWGRLADLPRAAVAAPTPAPLVDGRLLLVSGDDGTRVGFKPETAHPGFPRTVLSYDIRTNTWATLTDCPISRATAPAVAWENHTDWENDSRGRGTRPASGPAKRGGRNDPDPYQFVIPCGEARPGYRTSEVWTLSPKEAP